MRLRELGLVNYLLNRLIAHNSGAIIESGVFISKRSKLCGKNKLCRRAKLINSKIGQGSYMGEGAELVNTLVGDYSCIGPWVKVIAGEHPTKDFVSVHPAFYSLRKQAGFTYSDKQYFEELRYADKERRYHVTIGSDVWIGARATILNGVNIENGAIIAAGALVNNDIPAFAIVGGVPAKIIKYRFSQDEIDWLINLKWWEKNEDWLIKYAKYFNDVQTLKRVIRMEN